MKVAKNVKIKGPAKHATRKNSIHMEIQWQDWNAKFCSWIFYIQDGLNLFAISPLEKDFLKTI